MIHLGEVSPESVSTKAEISLFPSGVEYRAGYRYPDKITSSISDVITERSGIPPGLPI